MKPNVCIAQALAALRHGPAPLSDKLFPIPSTRSVLQSNMHLGMQSGLQSGLKLGRLMANLALSITLFAGLTASPALAKTVQVEGVHYQPEGLVIQLSGGKVKAPGIETWPNMKDGVNTELVLIRLPNCDGNFAAMQQAAIQEVNTHPEIKQFWITALDSEKQTGQGLQIALEIVTSASKPEFTPEALSQGDDQWVITLQGATAKANALQNAPTPSTVHPWQTASAEGSEALALSTNNDLIPEPGRTNAVPIPQASRSKKKLVVDPKKKDASDDQISANAMPGERAQDLLSSLTQAKQKQAELGAQVAGLQQALAESNAQKESLQTRLNVYENLLEEVGVNPNDPQKEDKAIIQNLKSALVKVAQKLKTAEEALAKENLNTVNVKTENAKTPNKPAQPVRNLVEDPQDETPPVATLGLADSAPVKKSASDSPAKQSVTPTAKPVQAPAANRITSATPALMNVYKAPAMATASATAKVGTASHSADAGTETRLQNAIRKNPVQVDNYLSLADYYVARQDLAKARDTLLKLTQVEPGGAQGYYYLTMIYLSQQDRKNAQAAMEQYVKRNPKDAQGIATLKKAIQMNGKANGKASSNSAQATKSPETGTHKMATGKP